jgi:hypothetical protein
MTGNQSILYYFSKELSFTLIWIADLKLGGRSLTLSREVGGVLQDGGAAGSVTPL